MESPHDESILKVLPRLFYKFFKLNIMPSEEIITGSVSIICEKPVNWDVKITSIIATQANFLHNAERRLFFGD